MFTEKQNKVIISSISILLPNLDKSYYISIIINDTKPLKTKLIEFQSTNQCSINQSFNLEPSIDKIEKIEFQMFEKVNIFANPLYKGEVKGNAQVKDEYNNNFVCYLKNPNGEHYAAIYYNFEFVGKDLFAQFNKDKDECNRTNSISFLTFSSEQNLKDYKLFIHNIDYFKYTLLEIESIIKWKNAWKTLSYLLCLSLIILWYKIFFIFILPFVIIFSHLIFKGKLEYFCINRTEKYDEIQNTNIFYSYLKVVNSFVNTYEKIIKKIVNGDKVFIENFYKNLFKMIIMNIIFFYVPLRLFISIRVLLVWFIWGFTLMYNPSFYAFTHFIINLIDTKLSFIYRNNKMLSLSLHCQHFIQMLIPFYSTYKLLSIDSYPFERNRFSSVDLSTATKTDSLKQNPIAKSQSQPIEKKIIKFEILEHERWWMFVGWTKNMLMDDIPLWCRADDTTKFCDKNMVFLPSEGGFKWSGEWKIEKNIHSDDCGWEYGSDFKGKYDKDSYGKYVRRRKWVRYATA